VQEDGALQRSGLIAPGIGAHVVFQIFVEVFAGIVERLTAFLQAADEKRAVVVRILPKIGMKRLVGFVFFVFGLAMWYFLPVRDRNNY
jgi:hypothetical protein